MILKAASAPPSLRILMFKFQCLRKFFKNKKAIKKDSRIAFRSVLPCAFLHGFVMSRFYYNRNIAKISTFSISRALPHGICGCARHLLIKVHCFLAIKIQITIGTGVSEIFAPKYTGGSAVLKPDLQSVFFHLAHCCCPVDFQQCCSFSDISRKLHRLRKQLFLQHISSFFKRCSVLK